MQAPDGTIWKIATSAKKDTGPATRQIDQIVLLLGAADVAASKRFYTDRGLAVAKSFGREYVEFATPSSPVRLALYGRRALAKDAGVAAGRHRIHRLMIDSGRPVHRPGRVRLAGRAALSRAAQPLIGDGLQGCVHSGGKERPGSRSDSTDGGPMRASSGSPMASSSLPSYSNFRRTCFIASSRARFLSLP